jgi:hypothetical protein
MSELHARSIVSKRALKRSQPRANPDLLPDTTSSEHLMVPQAAAMPGWGLDGGRAERGPYFAVTLATYLY